MFRRGAQGSLVMEAGQPLVPTCLSICDYTPWQPNQHCKPTV